MLKQDLDGGLTDLAQNLGPFVYRWLQACSVSDTLDIELTLRIGEALASDHNRTSPTEAEFFRLAVLPWFRQGWIPDGARATLQRGLSRRELAIVRRATRSTTAPRR